MITKFDDFVNENTSLSQLMLTQDFIDKVNNILKDTFNDYTVKYSRNIITNKGSKVSLESIGDNRTVNIKYKIDPKRKIYRWVFEDQYINEEYMEKEYVNEEIKISGNEMTIEDLAELASRVGWEYNVFLEVLKDVKEHGMPDKNGNIVPGALKGEEAIVKLFNEYFASTKIEWDGNKYFNFKHTPSYSKNPYSGLRDA